MEIESVVQSFVKKERLPQDYIQLALKWFTPLCELIIKHHASADKPILVGINGCQGSGKSTLSGLLNTLLNDFYGKTTITLSIDDFYLSRVKRLKLAKDVHPLLQTRGVPGTHDISLLADCLHKLKNKNTCRLPVFDKSIDDLRPESEYIQIDSAFDVIILEGWCVGIDAQNDEALLEDINLLETIEDQEKTWRRFVNQVLKEQYSPVFSMIDYMVMLQAPSFDTVFQWRQQQEQKLIEKIKEQNLKNLKTMDAVAIKRFIQHYQRLTEHALLTLPSKSDTVFTFNEDREIIKCRMT